MRRGPAPERRVLLADADAFYVAVARRVDPEGAGRARLLIVGGRPGSRGVVCSASYEARAFGVRSAMPIARALRLCPGAMCVPVPGAECGRQSRSIARILARFTPVVEAASIDEWYLDLSGTEQLYQHESLERTSHRIRDAVLAETGFSVSFGGGTNRLVAKLAVELAKPRPGSGATGVFIVPPGGETAFMRRFTLADIPGVGPRFRARLEVAGFRSVPDVLDRSEDALVRAIGARAAAWLSARARGSDSHDVRSRRRSKSLSHETTFDRDVGETADLERALLGLATRVASDLRAHGLACRTISVKLRDADFRTRRAGRTLPSPVLGDRVIYQTARELLVRLRKARRVPARLLGIALTSLDAAQTDVQLPLLAPPSPGESDRDRALARTVDTVRAKFGRGAIGPAPLAAAAPRRGSPRPPSGS
jgi:DNA polymerase-4